MRDRRYVENAADWAADITRRSQEKTQSRTGLGPTDYAIELRLIGLNATLGALESQAGRPAEIGVLAIATAPTEALASEISKILNPYLLHHALTDDEPMPTFAFPFSPAEMPRGALYEFALNHVMALDDPMAAFRLQTDEVGHE